MADTRVMDLCVTLLTVKVPTKKHEVTRLVLNSAVCTHTAIYGTYFISNEMTSQYFSRWQSRQCIISSCSNGSLLGLAQAYVLAQCRETYLGTLTEGCTHQCLFL